MNMTMLLALKKLLTLEEDELDMLVKLEEDELNMTFSTGTEESKDDEVKSEEVEVVQYWMSIALLPCIGGFGILGNVGAIVTLLR